MTATGENRWPPLGRNRWPLTNRKETHYYNCVEWASWAASAGATNSGAGRAR